MYGVCRDFDQLRPKHPCSVEVGGKNAHFSSIILGLACLHVGRAFTGTALNPSMHWRSGEEKGPLLYCGQTDCGIQASTIPWNQPTPRTLCKTYRKRLIFEHFCPFEGWGTWFLLLVPNISILSAPKKLGTNILIELSTQLFTYIGSQKFQLSVKFI